PMAAVPLSTINGLTPLTSLNLAPAGTSYYKTNYDNFAPRIGAAYQLFNKPGRETVLRGGWGIFYDLGMGILGNAVTNFPSLQFKSATGNPSSPASPANAAPLPFDSNLRPIGSMFAADPNLKLPRTYQWNFSVAQSLGGSQSFTASYVAAQ